MKIGYARISTEAQSPRKLTAEQLAHAREAIDGGMQTPAGMAALLGVDYSPLRRAMRGESSMASAMGGGRNADQ